MSGYDYPFTRQTVAGTAVRRVLPGSLWLLLSCLTALVLLARYKQHMDVFEQGILFGTALFLGCLGRYWSALPRLALLVAVLSLAACLLYGSDIRRAEQRFLLQYCLSSPSLFMWMGTLFLVSFVSYVGHLWRGSVFMGQLASGLCWAAVTAGLSGLLVRWRESWLLGTDIGHIPISNLYEVFILFCVITALIYLYYESRAATRGAGAFVLLLICAAVGFLLWYAALRGGHAIQPLVPALQSYWMKLHVPANFIAYGCFSIAAMFGAARLLRRGLQTHRHGSCLLARLPTIKILDDIQYRSISLGFACFTLATLLGSLWAAEAWGAYWSWDPKETWALIVWLNYAAWLHAHIGRQSDTGTLMAWWSVGGLFVTLFAFLGVNLFLSGLHSYGTL